MTKPEQTSDADRTWKSLVAAARTAPSEPMTAVDADQVVRNALGARCARPQPLVRSEASLVSWAALFAVAASLLLTVVCWSDVTAAWSPEPAIFDLPVELEPLQ
jgi:hypothetical protein